MAHDREKYLVEYSYRDDGSEVSMAVLIPTWDHHPCTLQEARAIAAKVREEQTRVGTAVWISHLTGPCEGQCIETWERVRKSKTFPTGGWKYTRG